MGGLRRLCGPGVPRFRHPEPLAVQNQGARAETNCPDLPPEVSLRRRVATTWQEEQKEAAEHLQVNAAKCQTAQLLCASPSLLRPRVAQHGGSQCRTPPFFPRGQTVLPSSPVQCQVKHLLGGGRRSL